MCDFDICIDCKIVLEKRSEIKRAKTHRQLLARMGGVEVEDIVCLKTLCDKVAQIELARKLQRKTVSVGVNTVSAEQVQLEMEEDLEEREEREEREKGGEDVDEEDEDSSQCVTVLEKVTPTDSLPNDIQSENDLSEAGGEEASAEVYKVDVHLSNGHCAREKQKHKKLLIDQIREFQLEDSEATYFASKSCSYSANFKDQPNSLLSRLKLDGESLNSMSASPDIFHLRAPLVSWENFMTPSVSSDSSPAEF